MRISNQWSDITSMFWQRLLALFVALLLIPGLFGCARSAEPDEPAAIELASAQTATLSTRKADTTDADTTNEDRTETDTTWNCPPEVDGTVISLCDTSKRYRERPYVTPTSGEFKDYLANKRSVGDLNGDGMEDISLNFVSAVGNWGEFWFAVYAGCSDTTFTRVWGPEYAYELRLGNVDTVHTDWRPIRAFTREGYEFTYIFSGGSYMRKR